MVLDWDQMEETSVRKADELTVCVMWHLHLIYREVSVNGVGNCG